MLNKVVIFVHVAAISQSVRSPSRMAKVMFVGGT